MGNNHFHSVIAFFVVFALAAMLAWVTSPAKPCRCIKVGGIVKPNPNRKPGTVRAGDIMTGGVMCDEN